MPVISESWWFSPLGLENPPFSFALGFMKHLEELGGSDSTFTVGLGQGWAGPRTGSAPRARAACSVSEGEAHFSLDPQEVISIQMCLKYLL